MRTTAHELEKAILVRIAGGTYAPDSRLPTCAQLAAELGVNKNTVSKAYRTLAGRGYLHTSAGRGTFVLKRPGRSAPDASVAELSSLLALVVQEAKLAGLGRAQFQEVVEQITARYYDRASPRVGFVECNRPEATTLSRDLQLALGVPVEPLLLDEVIADPERYTTTYDVLAVNLSHLVLVEDRLPSAHGTESADIVGLLLPPDPDSLTQVVRLSSGTRLGIVCDLAGTLQSLTGMVAAFNPGLRMTGALTGDDRGVRELIRSVDVILVTLSATAALTSYQPPVPLIGVSFKVDERSVQQLAGRIAARARQPPRVAS
jgi:DNA-binding transcriptional regulator YhcF (GntR family)